uniref:DAN domain-containing protein n=1 Tax=Strigamia maritima TaxID=126957 RepID=T1J393_STRMM
MKFLLLFSCFFLCFLFLTIPESQATLRTPITIRRYHRMNCKRSCAIKLADGDENQVKRIVREGKSCHCYMKNEVYYT